MPEIYPVERGGRKCAHWSTSRYEPGRMCPVTVTEFTQRLGDACESMEALFYKRLARAGEVLSYNITLVPLYSRMRGWAE